MGECTNALQTTSLAFTQCWCSYHVVFIVMGAECIHYPWSVYYALIKYWALTLQKDTKELLERELFCLCCRLP